MESAVISRMFKRLFSHEVCSRYRPASVLVPRITRQRLLQIRSISTTYDKPESGTRSQSSWQQRTDLFPEDKSKEFEKYPLVTANDLRLRRERPRRVKMLMRDFIEDSLYNPSYGYFSHNVTIFTTPEPFDFHSIKSSLDFQSVLGEQYTAFEDALDAKSEEPSDIRQLWHTPTELFKPHYGDAIARYLVENYLLSHHPYHDLIVYELGAGNGTLMLNILDCIRDTYPDVYERTKYRIIEISPALADLQRAKVDKTAEGRGHRGKVEIINKSIFDWDTYVPEPCYVVALEVFDNLAHDAIRYDPYTNAPLQSNVLIDSEGEFYEFYASKLDPVAARFLRVRSAACSAPFNYPLRGPQWVRKFKANLPMSANLTEVEYIPTRLMEFFGVLQEYFPRHGLLASDFSSLPDTVPGINAPVVQTRWKRRTVPVRTPLVHQGYFDILFPTDFAVMEDMYQAMTGKLTRVLSHEEFLRRWAYVEDTEVKNGENPLLEFYKNAAVISTV